MSDDEKKEEVCSGGEGCQNEDCVRICGRRGWATRCLICEQIRAAWSGTATAEMCPLRRTHDSTRPNGCASTRPLGCGKRLQMEHSALVLNSDLQSGLQRVASSLL